MRTLLVVTLFVIGCGPPPKKPSPIVGEGTEAAPNCCCKTLPKSAEKEIIPDYSMKERMECSAANGDCVDDVQCNASGEQPQQQEEKGTQGVPPPPALKPAASKDGVPPPPVLKPSSSEKP